MIYAVDFDNCLAESDPKTFAIGRPNHSLINFVKFQRSQGNKVILWTTRGGGALQEAVMWAREQGIEFDAINDNIPEIVERWGGNSRKVYADAYIDDKNYTFAFRCPSLDRQIFEQAIHKR